MIGRTSGFGPCGVFILRCDELHTVIDRLQIRVIIQVSRGPQSSHEKIRSVSSRMLWVRAQFEQVSWTSGQIKRKNSRQIPWVEVLLDLMVRIPSFYKIGNGYAECGSMMGDTRFGSRMRIQRSQQVREDGTSKRGPPSVLYGGLLILTTSTMTETQI